MRVFVLAGAEQEQDPFDLSMPNETRKTFTYSALTSSEHFPCPSSHPDRLEMGRIFFVIWNRVFQVQNLNVIHHLLQRDFYQNVDFNLIFCESSNSSRP